MWVLQILEFTDKEYVYIYECVWCIYICMYASMYVYIYILCKYR